MRLLSTFALVVFFSLSSCWGQINDGTESASATASASSLKEKPVQSEWTSKRNSEMSKTGSVNESIRQKLHEPCNWDFEQSPWREIEKLLEKKYGINVVLTPSATDDSLTDDEPITENLTGVSVRNALRIMLQKKNATYMVKNGVVMIISLDDAEDAQYFSTVFINVRPLLAKIATLEKGRIGKPRIAQETNVEDKGQDKPVELVTAESLLTDLVHSTYQQDGWQQTGQGLATINILGGIAVLNCTEEFADGLRDFLTEFDYHLSQD